MNIGLGTAGFGTSISTEDSFAVLNTFIELGGEIIDTANNYAFWNGEGGESETVIGKWLTTVERSRVQIHTKIGALPLDDTGFDNMEGLSRQSIESAVNKSLARLNTDYIDVLYAHVDDPNTPLEETWSTFSELVRSGKVRKLGISNYSASRIIELNNVIVSNALEPISYAQYRYTVIEPREDADLGVQICLTKEVKQALNQVGNHVIPVADSPLLHGGFELNNELPAKYQTTENSQQVAQIQARAETLKVNPSAVVLHMLAEEGILPLTMTAKTERLAENLKLFSNELAIAD